MLNHNTLLYFVYVVLLRGRNKFSLSISIRVKLFFRLLVEGPMTFVSDSGRYGQSGLSLTRSCKDSYLKTEVIPSSPQVGNARSC